MALLAFAILVWGFAPSFFLRGIAPERFPLRPLNGAALVHGLTATAWFILLIVQALLISRRQMRLHRAIGTSGLAVGALVALTGIWATYNAARMEAENIRLAASLMVSVFEFLLFAALVGLAIAKRHQPQTHKRLLLLATIALTTAGMGRLGLDAPFRGLLGGYLLSSFLFVPLILWDIARLRRPHGATLLGIGAIAAVWTLNLAIRRTPEWQAIVAGLVG
jgi:hypothetical protein